MEEANGAEGAGRHYFRLNCLRKSEPRNFKSGYFASSAGHCSSGVYSASKRGFSHLDTLYGASIYDVRSGWREGGPQKADKRNKIS